MDTSEFLSPSERRPEGGKIVWAKASDGVRIRMALWPHEGAKGTVLLFNGRTEFIEIHGAAAKEFAGRGYALATLDWRGQGLSDRFLEDRSIGHVAKFSDYQLDVECLLNAVQSEGLPGPYFLLGHSMGGAIGLRALNNGLDVKAAAFSAPMWKINMSPGTRVFAWIVGSLSGPLGFRENRAPMTSSKPHVLESTLKDNALTGDAEMFEFLRTTITDNPDLSLAGPSSGWVFEALKECRRLNTIPLPDIPVFISVADQDTVVDLNTIREFAARWPSAELREFPNCRHEIMNESPELRAAFFDACAAHFDKHN